MTELVTIKVNLEGGSFRAGGGDIKACWGSQKQKQDCRIVIKSRQLVKKSCLTGEKGKEC